MAAPRGAIRNWSEYLFVLGLQGMADLLPAGALMATAGGLARVSHGVLRKRSRLAGARVQACLGLPPDDPRVDAIVAGAFRTLALNAVEPMVVERRLDRGEPPQSFLSIEGGEHLEQAFGSGKGLLVCTGHFGAWELIPLFLARMYTPIWAMGRPMSNPLLDRYLTARRLRCARGTVSKDGGGLKSARILRGGEPLGMLLDQNAGRSGVILDFLGLPSSHHTVAGVLAQRFGALVLPLYMLREPQPLRFRLVVEPPLAADPHLHPDAAAMDLVRRLSRSLERRVRAHPEQWLWLHDRWRHALKVRAQGRLAPAPERRTAVPVAQGTNSA